MSIVPKLFCSVRFVRALNTPCFKLPASVKYSTLQSNCGYVSTAKPINQLSAINNSAIAQRFYSDKAGENQTPPAEKKNDGNGAKIIYTGQFKTRIIRVKMFSLMTSAMGLSAQPILLEKGMEIGGKGLATFLCTLAGVFTFVTPVLLHFVTKKYVIQITHDRETDEYVATTVSLFLMKNEVTFLAAN